MIGYKSSMSKENLSGLLDAMLDESSTRMEAEATEVAERARAEAALRVKAVEAEAEPDAMPSFDDVVEFTGLTDPDLREILGRAAPDDLLVVLATGADALQRRIIRNLGAESVTWVRQNLEHMEHVTDAERDGACAKMLKVANALLSDGTIGLPEPASVGDDSAPDPEKKELRELLTDLVRIAEQSGASALTEIAESAGEPLLREGLSRVVGGAKGDALRASLADVRAELEVRYARRLEWMVEALVAVGDGESADDFSARVFKDG